jgi:hypothetical protein
MKKIILVLLLGISLLLISACASSSVSTQEKEYTTEGNLTYASAKVDGSVTDELRRVFQNSRLEGIGIFENENEGLARRSALSLAEAELARKVQSLVKSETVIYNNKDVRDVVETQVHALVKNYEIESAGYDPGTIKYRVKIFLYGENLLREIETRIQ